MPRVPRPDSFAVAPDTFAPRSAQAATPRVDPGAQVRDTARAVDQLGGTLAAIDNEEMERANALRVDDALNAAREAQLRLAYDKEAGYTNVRGRDALERQSGKPLHAEYGETLQNRIGEIAGTLGNDAQRRAFAEKTNQLSTTFRADIMRHEAREFQTYTLSVRDGTIRNRVQEIGLNYNRPQIIDDAITSIRAAAFDMARLTGKSGEEAHALARQTVSNAHKTALAAAMKNNDITYADSYLSKYGKDMEADDLLEARGMVTKEMDYRVGIAAGAQAAEAAAADVAATDFKRIENITLQSESGNRRYAKDGRLLESPKGAKGEMQVLDSTMTDPGFGVTPARDDSPDERARVGRDYLGALLKRYDGDPAKMWAAYNWGHKRVDAAVARADALAKLARTDPAVQARHWLDSAPKETRDYVKKNMAALGSGAGRPPAVTLESVKRAARENPSVAGNRERERAAEESAERRFRETQAAIKAEQDAGYADVIRALEQNGGDFAGLPANVRAMVPLDKLDDARSYAKKLADGNDTTDERVYAKLAASPDAVRRMTDDEFMALSPYLSKAHLKHFADMRGKGPDEAAQMATATQQKAALIAVLGLKDKRAGLFHIEADKALLAAQQTKGANLSQEERQKVLDRLVLRGSTPDKLIGSGAYAFEAVAEGRPFKVDWSDDQRRKARAALVRKGIKTPSEAQIHDALAITYGVAR